MGEESGRKSVLDAGALIGIDRGDRSTVGTVLEELGGTFIVPAGVLAQVWRDGTSQVRLARFLNAERTTVEDFDELRAKAAGELLARSGTSDVVDASVALAARQHRAIVLTADPEDLRRLDPLLEIVRL